MIKNHKALFVASLLLIFVATTYQVSAQGTFSPTASFKFTAGTKVKTTSNLKVRLTASIYSQEVGTQSVGAVGTVVAGPIVSNGYTWWKYDFLTGADGWAVDDYVSSEQATSVNNGTVAPTTGASNVSTKFQGGDSVQTTATVNVRVSPGTGSSVLGQQVAGAIGTLPNGTGDIPMYVSGYWWWRVNFNSGASGWVVENYLVKANVSSNPLPVVTLTASPTSIVVTDIVPGPAVMLTWTATNSTACSASGGWSGSKVPLLGTEVLNPRVSATYTLACSGPGGSSSAQTAVTVTANYPPVPTTPASTKFQNGDSVRVSVIDSMSLRSNPGNTSTLISMIPNGTLGTITSGTSVWADGLWWWKVNFSGTEGWMPEAFLVKVGTSVPVPTVPTTPVSAKFQSGDRVGPNTANVIMRYTANGTFLRYIAQNEVGTITSSAPVSAGGYAWWEISWDQGEKAWSAEQFLTKISGVVPPTVPPTSSSVDLKANGQDSLNITVNSPIVLTYQLQNITPTIPGTQIVMCTASGGVGNWAGVRYANANTGAYPMTISMAGTYSFKINCGSATDSVTVTVNNLVGAPTTDISIDLKVNNSDGPLVLTSGQSASLTWNVTNATSCDLSGWGGVPVSTGLIIFPVGHALYPTSAGKTYTLICSNATYGKTQDTVAVTLATPTNTSSNVDIKAGINYSNITDGPLTVTNGWPLTLHLSATNLPSNSVCKLNFPYNNYLSDPYPAYTAVGGTVSATFALGIGSQFYPTPSGTTYTLECKNSSGNVVGTDSVVASTPTISANNTFDIKVSKDGSAYTDGPLTVTSGQRVYIKADYSVGNGAVTCYLNIGPYGTMGIAHTGFVTWIDQGSADYPTAGGKTYTLTCSQSGGTIQVGSDSATVSTLVGAPLPVSVDLKASADGVSYSDSAVSVSPNTTVWLKWDVPTGISYLNCNILDGGATKFYLGGPAGAGTNHLWTPSTAGTTYTLNCGTSTDSVRATTVYTAPVVTLTADKTTINPGDSVKLTWSSTGTPSYCRSSSNPGVNNWQTVQPISGSLTLNNQLVTTTYTLTCYNSAGQSGVNSVNVVVSPTTADLKVNGSDGPISPGLTSVKLTWTTANVTSCTLNGGSFYYTPQAASNSTGIMTTSAGTVTYTLNCSGAGGSANDSVTVNYGGVAGNVSVDVKGNSSDGSVNLTNGSAFSVTWNVSNLPSGGTCQLLTSTNTYDLGNQTTGTWIFYYGWSDYPTASGSIYRVTCKSSTGSILGSDSVIATVGTGIGAGTVDPYASLPPITNVTPAGTAVSGITQYRINSSALRLGYNVAFVSNTRPNLQGRGGVLVSIASDGSSGIVVVNLDDDSWNVRVVDPATYKTSPWYTFVSGYGTSAYKTDQTAQLASVLVGLQRILEQLKALTQ